MPVPEDSVMFLDCGLSRNIYEEFDENLDST